MTLDPSLMGDLVLGVGGAVAGGLVVAIAAMIGGRNAGLGFLAAGVVLGGFGLPVGWRVVTQGPATAQAATDDGLGVNTTEDKALAAVMKKYYPHEYDELKDVAARGRFSLFQDDMQVQRIAADLVRRQAPLADDENMMSLVRMARDAGVAARANSPKQCAAAMDGGAMPMGAGVNKTEAVAAITRFLEQTATHPASGHGTVDLHAVRERLVTSALARLPSAERKTIEANRFSRMAIATDPGTQKAYCDLAIGLFDTLLDRSPHESAGVMRTLLAHDHV